MGKPSRKIRYFTASVLFAAALFWGSQLKRGLIKYLGGHYGIMTEFYSDQAANTFHKFCQFRNIALMLTGLSVLLLTLICKRSENSKKSLFVSLLLFAVGCIVSAVILNLSANIIYFTICMVCCFALYIIAAYTVISDR